MKRLLLPLAAVVCLAAAPAWAGDDEAPKKDPKPAETKGSETKGGEKKAEPAPPPVPPAIPPAPGGMTRQDIEELVRRGGRLPEGFIPHGMRPGVQGSKPTGSIHREPPFGGPNGLSGEADEIAMHKAISKATGKLILGYFAAKDDPVRAKVYETVLRELGTSLEKGESATVAAQMPRTLGRFMAEFQRARRRGELARSRAYREVLQILGEAMATADRRASRFTFGEDGPPPTAPVPPRAVPAPPVPDAPRAGKAPKQPKANPFQWPGRPPMAGQGPGATAPLAPSAGNWPASFVGAELLYVGSGDPKAPLQIMTRRVPESSLAYLAGIKPGDTILAIDGKAVTPAILRQAEKAFTPGGKLQLKLRRMDGTIEVLDLEFERDDEPAKADK